MTNQSLQSLLVKNHTLFIQYIDDLSDESFLSVRNDKWSPGQQLEHIRLSVAPLVKGLMFPEFMIKWKFGKANRPSKTYDELVAKYNVKLKEGGRAPGNFSPSQITIDKRAKKSAELHDLVKTLNKRVNKFSEKSLDTIVIPHPLLGKLTLREMMYFTIHHVEHHLAMTQKNLSE